MHESSKKLSIKLLILLLFSFLFLSCGNDLPVEKEITKSFTLVNQDSSRIIFPDDFKDNITVMSFIFINCPDICPMTTNNMKLIQDRLKKEGLEDVEFISVSFDPERDRPYILNKFAEIRNIDKNNFLFATGEKQSIDSLLKVMNVYAIPGDTIRFDDGSFTYSFIHTDRITLIDREGRIRKEYKGSKINISEIIDDIKTLE